MTDLVFEFKPSRVRGARLLAIDLSGSAPFAKEVGLLTDADLDTACASVLAHFPDLERTAVLGLLASEAAKVRDSVANADAELQRNRGVGTESDISKLTPHGWKCHFESEVRARKQRVLDRVVAAAR